MFPFLKSLAAMQDNGTHYSVEVVSNAPIRTAAGVRNPGVQILPLTLIPLFVAFGKSLKP